MSDVFLADFTEYGDTAEVQFAPVSNELKVLSLADNKNGYFVNNSEPDQADVQMILRMMVTVINTHWLGGIIRWTDVNNFYYFRTRDTGGTLEIKKRVAGVDTLLMSTQQSFLRNNRYWFRFTMKGTEIQIDTGGSGGSPSWTTKVVTSDSDLTTGKAGFLAMFGGGATSALGFYDDVTFNEFS